MADRRFEDKPATKRDLAQMSETLTKEIHKGDEDLSAQIKEIRENMVTKADMKAEFHNLREILKGPHGIAERLEKVEERVGLR